MSISATAISGNDFRLYRPEARGIESVSRTRWALERAGFFLAMIIRYFVIVSLSLASMVGGMAAYNQIFQTSYFSVDEVVVNGSHKTVRQEIIALSGISMGHNTFRIDLKSASERIMANPWVENVLIRRELPDRLVIDVTERTPFAKFFAEDKVYLIDDQGYIMDEVSGREYRDLPMIGGESLAKSNDRELVYPRIFLKALYLLKLVAGSGLFTDPVAGIRIDNRNEMTIFARGRSMEIRVDQWDLKMKMARLKAIFDYARMEGKTIKTVDLCYKKKAVVRFADD